MKYRYLLLLAVLLVAFPTFAQEANLLDACVADYDSEVDYFPTKINVEAAEGFNVEYFNNYKLVTINQPWQDAERPIQYALVQCGTPAPEGLSVSQVIEVPVQRAVTMSTTILPHIVSQNVVDQVIGVDTILYTNTPEIIEKHAAGDLAEVSPNFGEINVELLLDLEPGLIMAQRFSSADTIFPTIEEAGLPVVVNADFLDTSPLGQAEWGKYISLFFNTEAEAEAVFDGVQARYAELTALVAEVNEKPTVFANVPYDGSWFMPGGESYLAQLLEDAGANYLWADDEATGSIFLDFESVLDAAVNADYWVNAGFFWFSKADALAEDERFAGFEAFEAGNVYSNNARVNENGGTDYFESGVANPDVILADLIKIFHPDVLPDYELYYYRQLGN